MSKFSVQIEGLDQLRNKLSGKRVKKDVAFALAEASTQLHSALNFAVVQNFTANKQLSSVQIGRRRSTREIGKLVLETSLEYKDSPLPLTKFRHEIFPVEVPPHTRFPVPNSFGFESWEAGKVKRKTALTGVSVQIRTKESEKAIPHAFTGKISFKGIKATQILKRVDPEGASWIVEPSEADLFGVRAPYKTLFGPSLARMAEKMFDSNDPGVERAKQRAVDIIAGLLYE